MRLARVGDGGAEIPALLDRDRVFDLRSVVPDIGGATLAGPTLERIRAAHATGSLPELAVTGSTRFGAPIARAGAIVCVGMNYAAHAAESGSRPPTVPILFLKAPNTLAGPNDAAYIPRGSTKTDWEVELGVVIGRRALYLDSPTDAISHVAGFVAANDLSEREFQLEVSGGQWSKGKCAPGFSPIGPYLVTPDEVDHKNLRLRSWVNGEPRQDSTTADMIFDVEYLIWHISQYMALDPGDIVLTGTPQGVALSGRFPYLSAGDIVEIEVDGLGRQRQIFVQA